MNKFIRFIFVVLIAVMCTLLLSVEDSVAKKKKRGPVELDIQVKDGFHLIGQLDIPKKAKVKNKVPLVVFLHSIGNDSTEWGSFPLIVKETVNVATLTLDFRGHGKSIRNGKNKKVYRQYFSDKSYKKFPDDVLDVLKYIRKEYPEIDCSKIALTGSNLGANMGLMAGSYSIKDESITVKTIIMISPLLKYKGFDLRLPIVRYGKNPLLLLVSKKDNYSYQSCLELVKFAQGKKSVKVYPFGGNGVSLIKFQKEAGILIIDHLKTELFPEAPEIPRKKKI